MHERFRPVPIIVVVTLVMLASAVLGVLVRPADPVAGSSSRVRRRVPSREASPA